MLTISHPERKAEKMIARKSFGKLTGDKEAALFTLSNKRGMVVGITDYGATVVSIRVPDRDGRISDVTLGYDNVEGYVHGTHYFGATVGRYANRIAGGKFRMDGSVFRLPTNNGANTLHGGPEGFSTRLWSAVPEVTNDESALRLTYVSRDGEGGFPGTLKVTALYALTEDNSIRVRFTATTDKPTVINMTYHNYFNLSGDPDTSILDEELTINADRYTPVDSAFIPTGAVLPVAGTPMDFRNPSSVGAHIEDNHDQLRICGGYDLNWVLDNHDGTLHEAAELFEPSSGRLLIVYTDQPGLQFYSGNFLDGTQEGKDGVRYKFRTALALETQHFPDSPNKPKFPSTRLLPGETYDTTTIFSFSVRK